MKYDLVICGRFVDPIEGIFEGRVGVIGERIANVGHDITGGTVLAFNGYIFPGFVDMHVHPREDSSHQWDYKEDFLTCSRAAAAGGVTTICAMPNTPRPAVDRERILEQRELAKKGITDIHLYGGVTEYNIDKLERMSDLVVGYKIYTCETTGGLMMWYEDIDRALGKIKNTGKPVLFHCEDPDYFIDGKTHSESRPVESELASANTVLEMTRRHQVPAHITHATSGSTIELLQLQDETCDATPHHLYYNNGGESHLLKMNPPLRREEDRASLMTALRCDEVDAIGSDHAPHTLEDKERGACGVPQLDTYGSFIAWLIGKGMVPRHMAQVTSYNPAKILGLEDVGRIEEGYYANFAVVDIGDNAVNGPYYTKCGWSCFDGEILGGRVSATIYHGKLIQKDGVVLV